MAFDLTSMTEDAPREYHVREVFSGSIISTIRRTTERGVKNSPPFCPPLRELGSEEPVYRLSAARSAEYDANPRVASISSRQIRSSSTIMSWGNSRV